MLMGEHAVLHGHRSLCAAIDRRIRVRVRPRSDRLLRLRSALGEYETDLDHLVPLPPFGFVLASVRTRKPARGLDLEIDADFSASLGFGSSSAVTLATLAALDALVGAPLDRSALFERALAVYRDVQGRGSGADLAAATHGGVVLYRATPLEIEPIVCDLPLSAHYAGYKTPTAEVVARVEETRLRFPALFGEVFRAMDRAVDEAARALRGGDLTRLASLFRIHQGLQTALGTCDETLGRLVYGLEKQPDVLAAKISGSGLGDCVIALGGMPSLTGHEAFRLRIDTQGVHRDV